MVYEGVYTLGTGQRILWRQYSRFGCKVESKPETSFMDDPLIDDYETNTGIVIIFVKIADIGKK